MDIITLHTGRDILTKMRQQAIDHEIIRGWITQSELWEHIGKHIKHSDRCVLLEGDSYEYANLTLLDARWHGEPNDVFLDVEVSCGGGKVSWHIPAELMLDFQDNRWDRFLADQAQSQNHRRIQAARELLDRNKHLRSTLISMLAKEKAA